jgi:hypothetical protein
VCTRVANLDLHPQHRRIQMPAPATSSAGHRETLTTSRPQDT